MALAKKTVAAGSIVLVIGVLFALSPRTNLCDDEIRGFKNTASSSLGVIREKLQSINGQLGTEQEFVVPQIEGLDVNNIQALKTCDIHCKLLRQCTRFRIFSPPSEACPTEYQDFKVATSAANELLASLRRIDNEVTQTEKVVGDLGAVREDKEKLAQTSGSIGGTMSILLAKERALQQILAGSLQSISADLERSLPATQ